ncbi:hypothetical protein L208DRAFT_1379630 [Tricholoma matsutake]|nr:hypothetical protein L208DRAFT_1379630 [Tricholoma matsutake 945]
MAFRCRIDGQDLPTVFDPTAHRSLFPSSFLTVSNSGQTVKLLTTSNSAAGLFSCLQAFVVQPCEVVLLGLDWFALLREHYILNQRQPPSAQNFNLGEVEGLACPYFSYGPSSFNLLGTTSASSAISHAVPDILPDLGLLFGTICYDDSPHFVMNGTSHAALNGVLSDHGIPYWDLEYDFCHQALCHHLLNGLGLRASRSDERAVLAAGIQTRASQGNVKEDVSIHSALCGPDKLSKPELLLSVPPDSGIDELQIHLLSAVTPKALLETSLLNLLKECSAMKYDAIDKKQFGIKSNQMLLILIVKSVLVDTSSAQPKRVMVWLDTEEVKRVFKSRDVDSSSNSDGEDPGDSGMSKKDDELARLCGKLEQWWGNNSDSSYAYIDHITGQHFPLTPFMMDEWVRGMYDGKATVDMPPAETCFDPANCLTSIAPPHSRSRSASSSVPASSDLAHPFHPTSPPVFTPSKLTLFLEHAEKNLGVASASIYETDLRQNSYGPDILHLVDTQALTDLGIPVGDAVRLKNGSQAWWSEPKVKNSKHKAVDQPPESPPDPKKYRFEMHFNDGGGTSYFGSAIEPGKPDAPPCDYTWWFFCPLTQ